MYRDNPGSISVTTPPPWVLQIPGPVHRRPRRAISCGGSQL
ncbi:hypothetical protein [Streptomyces tendae]